MHNTTSIRIHPLQPDQTAGATRSLLDGVAKTLGMVPNMMRTMAQSPAALGGYLALSGALGKGSLPLAVREQIALAVAEANACDYCLAAHTLLGGKAGIAPQAMLAARRGEAEDPYAAAALRFAQQVVTTRGAVADTDLALARSAGLDDGDLVEIVAHVALNVLTNYVNRLAGTAIDFPPAPALTGAA